MTPKQLLDEVKCRFYALLHCEPHALNVLLKQALGAYQDRAGAMEQFTVGEVSINNGIRTINVPSDFLSRVMVKDKYGNFVASAFDRVEKKLVIEDSKYTLPLRVQYFANLRNVDLENYELNPTIVGLIQDYLEVLIAIPNSERLRRTGIAGNLDTSDIPTEADLHTRKQAIEERMTQSRSALPMISIHP